LPSAWRELLQKSANNERGKNFPLLRAGSQRRGNTGMSLQAYHDFRSTIRGYYFLGFA
jgi:hypothetical protein